MTTPEFSYQRPEELATPTVKDIFAVRTLLIAIAHRHETELRRNYRKISFVAPTQLSIYEPYEEPIESQLSATLLSRNDRSEKLALWFRQFSHHPDTFSEGLVASYVFEWRQDELLAASRSLHAAPKAELMPLDSFRVENISYDDDLPEKLWAEDQCTKAITKGDCQQLAKSLGEHWQVSNPAEVLAGRA